MRSQSSGSSDSRLRFLTFVPALLTRMSIVSMAAATSSMADLTVERSAMSQVAIRALSPPVFIAARARSSLLRSRPTRATRRPIPASVTAIAWPIPLPAPVTSAVCKVAANPVSLREKNSRGDPGIAAAQRKSRTRRARSLYLTGNRSRIPDLNLRSREDGRRVRGGCLPCGHRLEKLGEDGLIERGRRI